MTNRSSRSERTSPSSRWAGLSSPVWLLVAGVWLGSLLNLALNTATNTTTRYPGPLRLLQDYPWQATALLTLILAVLAWRQHRQTATTQPQDGPLLPRVLTLRQETAPAAAEFAGLRRQLLEQVRRTWIKGVLDRSLAQVARVELGLAERPAAVDHPWGALLVQPGQPDQVLPPGTRIAAVAGRFDRQLLILGAPGAGKTTLLLEYARDLLAQADQDAAAPIPVVFHLSAWPAEQPPLTDWLVGELALRYGVSRRLAVELVDRDRLAVLLDGLDEVPADRRLACVEAVNAYRAEHGGVPLVVCARSREYQELAARLVLNGAVAVQPLDRRQVRGWLAATGRPLAGLRAALGDRNHWLWELLDNPLLLSVAALTYQGQPASAVRAHGSVEGLLGAYVQAMLARPRAPLATRHDQAAYADADTLRWLGWLAEQMGAESVFYPDWMQPDWLPTRWHRWLVTTGFGLASAAIVGPCVGLGVGVAVEVNVGGGLPVGLSIGQRVGLSTGLLVGLFSGLLVGLTRRTSHIEPIEPTRWSWRTARRGLLVWLRGGLLSGLLVGLLVALPVGLDGALGHTLLNGALSGALVGGLFGGLGGVLASGFETSPNLQPAAPLEGIRAAGQTGRTVGLGVGLLVGLLFGLAGGLLAGGLYERLPVGLLGRLLVDGLYERLPVGLVFGLLFGLLFGLAGGLAGGLMRGGAPYLRHRLLILLLRRQELIPADLIGFIDYADSRILLRRAGGGYLFIHRLLQDYFLNRAHQSGLSQTTGTQPTTGSSRKARP